jgi:hypothetical protein
LTGLTGLTAVSAASTPVAAPPHPRPAGREPAAASASASPAAGFSEDPPHWPPRRRASSSSAAAANAAGRDSESDDGWVSRALYEAALAELTATREALTASRAEVGLLRAAATFTAATGSGNSNGVSDGKGWTAGGSAGCQCARSPRPSPAAEKETVTQAGPARDDQTTAAAVWAELRRLAGELRRLRAAARGELEAVAADADATLAAAERLAAKTAERLSAAARPPPPPSLPPRSLG